MSKGPSHAQNLLRESKECEKNSLVMQYHLGCPEFVIMLFLRKSKTVPDESD